MKKRYCNICLLLLILFLFGYAESGIGQNNQQVPDVEEPLRVGLVLSGGGAKGIAHIGVLEAIERAGLRIDYITGTSMGSLVGGLYAIGYSTEQLAEIVLADDFTDLFRDRRDRRFITNYEKVIDERTVVTFPLSRGRIALPQGVITGQSIYTLLSRLSWPVAGIHQFDDFQIPFAAIGTDLETGEAKVFRSGYLPDALRASMSIPSVFTPVEIDGDIYVDGGMIRNLPVEDAYAMGANFTIAVDVGSRLESREHLGSLTSVMNQALHFRIIDNTNYQATLANEYFYVEGLGEFSSGDFDKAAEILELGRRTGESQMELFRTLAARQGNPSSEQREYITPQPLPFSQIVIEGNTLLEDQQIRNLLGFTPGSLIHPDLIEERIGQLYSSQYIRNIFYRIEKDREEYILRIRVLENLQDSFGVGIRYENDTQASLLLTAGLQNLFRTGSVTRLEARLGQKLQFRAEQSLFSAFGSRFAVLSSITFLNEEVEWFDGSERVSRHDVETLRGELSWGNYFSSHNLFSAGIRREHLNHNSKINPELIRSSDRDHHALFFRFFRDNLDRVSFTTRGNRIVFEGYYSDPAFLSPIQFSSFSFYYQDNYAPLPYLTLRYSLWTSYSTGKELPWSYWKSANRYEPMYGYIRFGSAERYELSSRNLQFVSAGIQVEPISRWFFGIDGYGGRFTENYNLNVLSETPDYGISMSIGTLSLIGPVKLILSSGSRDQLHAEFQVGFHF